MASSEDWCPTHRCPKFNCKVYHEAARADVMPDSPAHDPISPAHATGIEFWHVYQANIKAGFSPSQSLYLLAVQMTNNPGPAPRLPEED